MSDQSMVEPLKIGKRYRLGPDYLVEIVSADGETVKARRIQEGADSSAEFTISEKRFRTVIAGRARP